MSMRKSPVALGILLASCGVFSASLSAQPASTELPLPSLAPMVKRVSPAVVNIATRGTIKE